MSEAEDRKKIVDEALSWIGTPYVSNGDIKGAGVDCGMLLVRVYVDTGFVKPFDPRPYPAQWALHQSAEVFLGIVTTYAHEINQMFVGPGDIALYKFGKCWAHGSIVVDWPRIVHANPTVNPQSPCREDNAERNTTLQHRPVRFFSIFPRE